MTTLKTVLPNFTKALVFLASALFTINTFAAEGEAPIQQTEAVTEEVSEATSDSLGAVAEQVEEVAEEAVEEAVEEIPDLKDMASE